MSADNKLTLADLRRSISRCPPKKERKSSHLRHSLNCVEYFEFSSSTINRIKTFSRNMGTSSTHQNTNKKNQKTAAIFSFVTTMVSSVEYYPAGF